MVKLLHHWRSMPPSDAVFLGWPVWLWFSPEREVWYGWCAVSTVFQFFQEKRKGCCAQGQKSWEIPPPTTGTDFGKQTLPVTVTHCESYCLFEVDAWEKMEKKKREMPELWVWGTTGVFTGVGWDDSTGKGNPAAGLKVGTHELCWTKGLCYER